MDVEEFLRITIIIKCKHVMARIGFQIEADWGKKRIGIRPSPISLIFFYYYLQFPLTFV